MSRRTYCDKEGALWTRQYCDICGGEREAVAEFRERAPVGGWGEVYELCPTCWERIKEAVRDGKVQGDLGGHKQEGGTRG